MAIHSRLLIICLFIALFSLFSPSSVHAQNATKITNYFETSIYPILSLPNQPLIPLNPYFAIQLFDPSNRHPSELLDKFRLYSDSPDAKTGKTFWEWEQGNGGNKRDELDNRIELIPQEELKDLELQLPIRPRSGLSPRYAPVFKTNPHETLFNRFPRHIKYLFVYDYKTRFIVYPALQTRHITHLSLTHGAPVYVSGYLYMDAENGELLRVEICSEFTNTEWAEMKQTGLGNHYYPVIVSESEKREGIYERFVWDVLTGDVNTNGNDVCRVKSLQKNLFKRQKMADLLSLFGSTFLDKMEQDMLEDINSSRPQLRIHKRMDPVDIMTHIAWENRLENAAISSSTPSTPGSVRSRGSIARSPHTPRLVASEVRMTDLYQRPRQRIAQPNNAPVTEISESTPLLNTPGSSASVSPSVSITIHDIQQEENVYVANASAVAVIETNSPVNRFMATGFISYLKFKLFGNQTGPIPHREAIKKISRNKWKALFWFIRQKQQEQINRVIRQGRYAMDVALSQPPSTASEILFEASIMLLISPLLMFLGFLGTLSLVSATSIGVVISPFALLFIPQFGDYIVREYTQHQFLTCGETYDMEYKQVDTDIRDMIKECGICFDEFGDTDKIRTLECHRSHLFHSSCIHEWFISSKNGVATCPNCRKDVFDFI